VEASLLQFLGNELYFYLDSCLWSKVKGVKAKMMKQLQTQIRNLQRELAEIKNEQVTLRFQPCRGDSEISGKEAKFDELERRAKALSETIRDMIRKRQLLFFQSTTKGTYEFPNSSDPS
jgi:ribosomal protein L29